MRNLRNIQFQDWKPPAHFAGRPVTSSTWDLANNDSFLCTFGPTEDNPLIELVRVKPAANTQSHEIITSWDAPPPTPDVACDEIVSLHFFADSLTACLVLAGGDIVVVREEPMSGEDRIEIVGSVDAGITAARWSPDEEILAITTAADTVVFMSRSFEGITDITMTSEDLKASNHVSVGWGKKETQFQGKGAKALRDPTMPEKIDEGVLSPLDDWKVAISWRGDGAYLAVSKVEGGVRRLIRVYSREGVLDSVSEPADGLEGALSWRPAGNLIAGIKRLDDRVDVVFFERNGLRHGQFSLRLTPEQLQSSQHIKLSWNSDSTVLAVILADSIQLWTMGNYHWYLKQEIKRIHGPWLPQMSLVWHAEKSLRFMTLSTNSINTFEYIFTVVRGTTAAPNDLGVVGVIDGQTIKVTPFKVANIPPPMALHEPSVASNIVDVTFSADGSLAAVLHQQGIALFKWDPSIPSSTTPVVLGQLIFEESELTSEWAVSQQICFSGANEVITLRTDQSHTFVTYYSMDIQAGSIEKLRSTAIPVSAHFGMASFVEDDLPHAFIQLSSGDIQSLTCDDHRLQSCSLPFFMPWIELVADGENYTTFGMTNNGHLYANSRLLVKNCTSFIVTPAHLIFTTTSHLLKFVHITGVADLELPPDDPENDERCRSIERGARIVTAMPTALSLVLQMPRGNLETIWPRAMVVAGIRKLIDEKNYRKAFTHCRTQRVDMNILYDHVPEQFLANVPLFIDQLRKITYIDLFLSSLREEDVTQTMYKETRVTAQKNGVSPANSTEATEVKASGLVKESKINKICDAVLEVLKTRTSTNLQNIITANVCKSPPALDDGLLVVAQLMKEDEALAEKAVEHICFLADVNRLYENALGLYNLDLAVLVAQQSQKDPREYLPFMQSLQQMTELRRRFTIDDHLGRHSKALKHLFDLNVFEEIQAYIRKHILYQDALSLYRYQPEQLAKITELYAEYLESKSSFKEAALAYEALKNYGKATSCYLSSGPSQWRETFFSALSQTPPLPESSLTELANTIFDALMETKDYFSAATVQLEYLSSVETAAKVFCRGYFFADALHLVARRGRPELLETVIDVGLGEALASSTELLAECKAQLVAQVPRIRELRAKALADPLAFYEGERGGGDGDLPDDVSVAASSRISTNRSLFTRYTGRDSKGGSIGTVGTGVSRATSKNRRREERKRARGKKGSVYEEEYLVASVGRLVERVESVRAEIERLVFGLVRRGMWERARAIEASLAEVVNMCATSVPEVFGSPETAKPEEDAYRAVGGEAVLQESIEAASKRKEPPHISAFEKLCLLGT
ncbi:elongator complex protein-like protein 1 [Xylogone sp. PMI_703]|nr:elongator complex protein-like protein 1 [Xylogone sp. PMI_703]